MLPISCQVRRRDSAGCVRLLKYYMHDFDPHVLPHIFYFVNTFPVPARFVKNKKWYGQKSCFPKKCKVAYKVFVKSSYL